MSFPSFATGEVLTAADMNAVGLWLVKTQTIGTAVSSVTVNDCFSSTYNGYLVTVHGGTSTTADENVNLQLTVGGTASATGYYGTATYALWGSGLTTQSANNANNMLYAGGLDGRVILQLQIFNPAVATSTTLFGPFIRQALAGQTSYLHRVNTAYDGIRIAPGSGTLTGGQISVYGYKN
jgi:hypothetical protein